MSYILDALKKVEREKARKSRNKGSVDISSELYRDIRPVARKNGARRIIIIIIIAAASAATFGATWFFLKGNKGLRPPAAQIAKAPLMPAQAPLPPPVQQPPQPPVQPLPEPRPPLPQPPAPEPPVAAPVEAPAPKKAASAASGADAVRIKRSAPKPAAVPVVTEDEEDVPRKRGRRSRASAPASPRTEEAAPVSSLAQPPADIQVTGIAWQDERSARRAVVNGHLMKEGNSVAGARIAEIFKDRVRFSLGGSNFEVHMVASGMPGAGK